MALIVKKGPVTNIDQSTSIIGSNGNIKSQHTWSFRINGAPAKLKSSAHSSFAEGDKITAVGALKNGTLSIYAFRNETTGAYDQFPIVPRLILGLLLVAMGIPLCLILIGFPLLFYGIMILYEVHLGWVAKNLLERS